jgi:hypothetical protein
MDVDGVEILNTEAKFDEDGSVCEAQYKKNIRINHAIHRVARRAGVELSEMMPLDIRGKLMEKDHLYLCLGLCRIMRCVLITIVWVPS